MSDHYARYGMTEADVPYARAWEAHGRKVGLSPARIEEGFRWYQHAFKPGMTTEQVAESFRTFADRTWTDDDVTLAAKFHDAVALHGPQHLMPTDSERHGRLQQ